MKKFLLPMVAGAFLASASAVMAAEQKVDVKVTGMDCPSCPLIVRNSMTKVPSVKVLKFQAGPASGEGLFVVSFDDQHADGAKIVQAVEANGYPAKLVPANK